jgi:hypothetical protein
MKTHKSLFNVVHKLNQLIKNTFYKKSLYLALGVPCLTLLFTGLYANVGSLINSFDSSSIQQTILANAPELNPKVLKLSLTAYNHARDVGLDKQGILTIIDYSLPSAKRRLWVIDVNNGDVKFHTRVAHGKGSGIDRATHFSDKSNSYATSIGVYLTDLTYFGKHGYSLRLKGLEKGFNDAVYARSVVMHSAWYVSDKFVAEHGRVGRSWGCPALDKKVASQVINEIKNGSIIVAYYPDQNWMENSTYLHA